VISDSSLPPRGERRRVAAKDNGLFSYLKYFWNDKAIAAITPSSRYLVGRIMRAAEVEGARRVVEYGPGVGVVTHQILRRMSKDGRLLTVEMNPKFFAALSHRMHDPRVALRRGDARQIDRIAKEEAFSSVDAIVSGIPFAFLSPSSRGELLGKTAALLRPGGRFVAYQITLHLVPLLKKYFRRTNIEWEVRNIPPHFVMTAYK
jgi:phospholipid N-methyltransferase